MQIIESSVWSLTYVFILLFPFNSAKFKPSYGSSIGKCSQPIKNDQSEFNFLLAESSSMKNEFHLFHYIQDAFIVTQEYISWYLSIATASFIQFLHYWYLESIPDWPCLMLTKDKSVKRDTNALAMVSYSNLYGKLNSVLSDDSFIISENNLPVV